MANANKMTIIGRSMPVVGKSYEGELVTENPNREFEYVSWKTSIVQAVKILTGKKSGNAVVLMKTCNHTYVVVVLPR